MALGTVLVKPQPVAVPLAREVDISEIVADFVQAFTRNPVGAQAAADVFIRVAPEALRDFVHGFEERVRLSDGRMRQLFRPFGAGLDTFVQGVEKGTIVDVLSGALEAVSKVLGELTKAKVTAFVRALFDLARKDLGISDQTLRDLVTTLSTRIITELKRDVLNGVTSAEAISRYEFGAVLDGLKSLFDEEEIKLPGLSVEVLIAVIGNVWDQARIDRLLAWIQDLLLHRDDVLTPLAAVIEARIALRAQVSVSVTPGPAPATAAMPGRGIPRDAGDAAPAGPAEDPPIAWYASWVAARTVRAPESGPFPNRFQNEHLIGFDYKHTKRETMEAIAFHSAWAMPVTEGLLLHAFSLEQGDVLSNLHIIALDAIDFGLAVGGKGPIPRWYHWTFKQLMTMFLWGFESGWSRVGADNDPYVWTNAAGDIGEVLLYWRWSFLLRELLLSFLTLRNHDKTSVIVAEAATDKPVTCNADCIEGVCYTFWELGSMLVPLIIAKTSRNKYGFVGGGPTGTFWGIAFGGFAVAAACGYLSILLARAIAGEFPRDRKRYGWLVLRDRLYGPYRFEGGFSSFGKGVETIAAGTGTVLGFIFALATSIGDSPIYTYLFADGDTDDGTYCADSLGAERFSLAGYPAASTSPYMLPWGNDMKQCVQGNMGVWSHYPDASSQQTYAYDYSHDVGTEILASRAGIITQLRDNQPDNNPNNWNFVEVMHLLVNPAGGAAAVPVPAGVAATFADGTPIPAGTLFPPYWVTGSNTPLQGLPNPVPLHPSAAILPGATPTAPGALAGAPAYYAGFNGFNAGTTFAFMDPAVDRGIAGTSAGAAFSDGTPIAPAGGVVAPGTAVPPAPGTAVFPAGTTFVFDQSNNLQPLLVTFAVYGHCIFGFMQVSTAGPSPPPGGGITQTPRPSGLVDVYRSRNAGQVRGLFVPQGRVIALSGDTGISAYNHLHTQVYGQSSNIGFGWTLPFSYSDVRHGIKHGLREGLRGNGVPRSFTFYDSGNTRIAPT